MRSSRYSWLAGLGLAAIVGCGTAEEPMTTDVSPTVSAPAPAPTPAPADEGGAIAAAPAAADETALSEEEIAEVKKLPTEAEQTAALSQKACPVSGEHLGSMGMPIKVSAEGKDLYLCCKGCKEEFDKDPKAALAKLTK